MPPRQREFDVVIEPADQLGKDQETDLSLANLQGDCSRMALNKLTVRGLKMVKLQRAHGGYLGTQRR